MPNRPHIVIFNPDQWRGDVLGHMGNPAAVTPNLDQMVQTDAVSFRYAFCQNPVCTPSRCSFMTGWYPHVRGHRTMYHMLRSDEPVLLKTLKEAGYYVWWGGKNDLVPGQFGYDDYCHVKFLPPRPLYPNLHSVDHWRGELGSDTFYSFYYGRLEKDDNDEYYYDGDWANVLGAIDLIKNAPQDQPLCIYLSLGYPHPPYAVEDPYYSMIDRSKIPPRAPTPDGWVGKPSILRGICENQNLTGWSEDRWTELRGTYYGMCTRVDAQFGLLMEALRQAGIYDDTAVFVFADHGDFTGDYGLVEKTQNTFEDCLARRSLLAVLAGDTDEHRDAVFCEGGRLDGEAHCMELESTSFQNPQGLYWPRMAMQRSEGPEHTKAVMCRTKNHKYVYRLYESDELYDLHSDPAELNNRIDDPSLTGALTELKERLLTFFVETCDVVPHDADRRR
jgi:arylsulfatase A-like enzyme